MSSGDDDRSLVGEIIKLRGDLDPQWRFITHPSERSNATRLGPFCSFSYQQSASTKRAPRNRLIPLVDQIFVTETHR